MSKLKGTFILLYSSLVFGSSPSWTPHAQKLYSSRHFIELGHILVMQNKLDLIKKVRAQERDLAGCRSLNRGYGGMDSMILCMRFLDRENELKLYTPGRKKLISDINILCPTLLAYPESLKNLLEAKVFVGKPPEVLAQWRQCSDFAWRQVYLTVYANFDADPVGSLALVHKAQSNLTPNSFWSDKAMKVFGQKSEKE